ncbi:Poly [ADP-ribose] polymerase 2 [Fusarium oxysporum f. sp. cubense race 1]|uniref:Poly [ADP-ribose] polymerase n=1 Tax=Fusarium oxysporum f. sp. cubense (strain race 1) TaxID=1229664 RepID=N4TR24_FUSC1|nr:Poly [ADP-ribose] polymerase 2 [Fusarium oxysporum f. sp. cubense race 1]
MNGGPYENQPGVRADGREGKWVRFAEEPSQSYRVDDRAPTFNPKAKPSAKADNKNAPKKSSLDIAHDSELAYKARLNKPPYFYNIEVVKDPDTSEFHISTEYGRMISRRSLGDGSLDDAVNNFLRTFKEKTGLAWEDRNNKAIPNKYAFGIGREPVQELMQLVFNKEGFDRAKDALGYKDRLETLKKHDIERQLKTLAKDAALARKHHKNQMKAQSDKDHGTPPGAGKIENEVLKPFQIQVKPLQKLWDLSNAYEAMKITCNFGNEVHQFDRQLTPLRQESKEFKTLIGYLNNYGGNFEYKLKDIFRSNHEEERGGGNSERRLLWHGSRVTNYCSILSHGLQIPPPGGPLGKMLGKGIRLADMSSVAATYCETTSDALLLLCDAELPEENETIGRTRPEEWIDAEEVHRTLKGVLMPDPTLKPMTDESTEGPKYNTYICYDPTQVKLRYIFRLDICLRRRR